MIRLALLLLFVSGSVARAEERPGFHRVASYVARGGQFATAIAEGPSAGSERIYATYLYLEDTFEVLAIDPDTGGVTVFENPVPGEFGARSIAVGRDGNIYLGTLPHAHLVRLDVRTGRMTDLGRPAPGESYIWDLTVGSDDKIYGGTYPGARLVRHDPARGTLEDLGRLDPAQEYAHFVAASDDGFVYAGIGTARMNVAAYHIATGERRELLPPAAQVTGQANVYRAADGVVYAVAGTQTFRLKGWKATAIEASKAGARVYPSRLRDGRIVSLRDATLRVEDRRIGRVVERQLPYRGRPLRIFRMGLGPGDALYGSSVLPARLLRLDEQAGRFEELGELGGGEVFSFLSSEGRLLMAAYGCLASLMAYDPARPFQIGPEVRNPAGISYPAADTSWRPLAFVKGPGGRVYAGAIAGYGKRSGQLAEWSLARDEVRVHMPVLSDQGISALLPVGERLLGGSTVAVGGGATPAAKEALLFLWDPVGRRVVYSFPPVRGATVIENLALASEGRVYGIAGGHLFALDPRKPEVVVRRPLPFPGGTIYGALERGPDGRLWGLAGHPDGGGIFAIDPLTDQVELVARPPRPITGGFALRGWDLFFVSGADLYRFDIPRPRQGSP